MSDELFDVWQDFNNGTRERVLLRVPAEQAVKTAVDLTQSVGAQIGMTVRVIIVDGGDLCVFEWLRDKGVVFPPQKQETNSA